MMYKIKLLIVFLTILWVTPNSLFAVDEYPDHHWQPVYSDFNMTATFAVRIDGVMQTSPDLELGAFVGDVCRASFHLILTPPPFNTGVYITEGYNIQGSAGETITFRLYDHSSQSELDVVSNYSIVFQANQNIGNAVNPQYIDFYTMSSSYYMLITDESQLVEGRKYLIASGFDGTAIAVGGPLEGGTISEGVEITCANKKTNQSTPAVPAQGYVFQFTMGQYNDLWTLYDGVNMNYLVTDESGDLKLSENPMGWEVVITPDGKAKLKATVSETDQYLYYDSAEAFFSCDQDEDLNVFLFAQCDLISGTMASLTVEDPTRMLVVASGSVLDVTDLSTVHVSNLIIEDGAQLLNASEGVLATMQKTVEAYADITVPDGWYTVASPMVPSPVEEGSNLLFPDYDLYYFDETNLTQEEWRNYKNNANNGFTAFEAGRGYLYANGTSFTPIFKGTLNHADVTFPLTYTNARPDDLKGFNLVGNPYPHNIYKGAGGAIDDNHLASGFYVLTNDGSWMAETYETAILPGQGILVETAVAGDLSITKSNAVATGETISMKHTRGDALPRIAVNLSNGVYSDVAYLYLGEGHNLDKIGHFNPNNPSLYIHEDNHGFAIAFMDESTESVEIWLDNQLPGDYTLKVDAKDLSNGYLHLIDYVTGADIDLLRNPSYSFKATGREYASRFKLVLQYEADLEQPFAHFDGTEWVISDYEGAVMQVVDVMGRVLWNGQAKPHFSTVGLPSGVYVFRLVNGENERVQKVVLN